MKIIHCADLHLDSKMEANLDKDKARARKVEILTTFGNMVEYAAAEDIRIILISGDLFDTRTISATARNAVLAAINHNPDIHFYYLKGNHDRDNFLADLESVPDNLFCFGDSWTQYDEGIVSIAGVELGADNSGSVYNTLVLDYDRFNIVMLHGQELETDGSDKAEVVNLKALRNKNIDYLALGHVHARKLEELDKRAKYCYPGCLEGRGFDECGEHGFALIDIDEETGHYTHEFVNIAKRRLYSLEVDVSECESSAQMIERIEDEIAEAGCLPSALIKIVLVGTLSVECEKDPEYICNRFAERFFFAKLYDRTTLKVDLNDYRYDESLKGEFVRTVLQDDSLSEEDKAVVIRYGMQALAGEEVQ